MKRNTVQHTAILGIVLAICCAFIGAGLPFTAFTAHALSSVDAHFSTANCPSAAAPTSKSLLVVLLDRSGSLIFQPGATDPNGYSTSVARALTDLWPGAMAVIPFSGDNTQLPILGPDNLSDTTSRADLKNKIQDYPIGGNTPLAPAMLEALNLLHGSPLGSRVIIITDGNPSGSGNNDGPHQEQEIRNNLIAEFCQQGIPISTIGLAIDPSTPDGQDANRLLADIAGGTGAVFTRVANAQDLSKVVISLAAQWLGLTYSEVPRHGGTFPIVVDSFATEVSIITFRTNSQYPITLRGPNGKPVTAGLQQSTDRHYVIDSFKVPGGLPPGSYSVDAAGDPSAQVYILVSSSLRIQLITPSSRTVAYGDRPVQIQAEFLHGQQVLMPQT
ncbi:MAG: vWA domain-containing protein, partial [Ktedonobacteraceae bacterium]